MLGDGHGGDAAGRAVGARVRRHAGAGVVVAVRRQGEGQRLEVGADLLGQVHAEVGGVAVRLAVGEGEGPAAEVGPDLGVLQRTRHSPV